MLCNSVNVLQTQAWCDDATQFVLIDHRSSYVEFIWHNAGDIQCPGWGIQLHIRCLSCRLVTSFCLLLMLQWNVFSFNAVRNRIYACIVKASHGQSSDFKWTAVFCVHTSRFVVDLGKLAERVAVVESVMYCWCLLFLLRFWQNVLAVKCWLTSIWSWTQMWN